MLQPVHAVSREADIGERGNPDHLSTMAWGGDEKDTHKFGRGRVHLCYCYHTGHPPCRHSSTAFAPGPPWQCNGDHDHESMCKLE